MSSLMKRYIIECDCACLLCCRCTFSYLMVNSLVTGTIVVISFALLFASRGAEY
ncbi:hypothetical protein DAPPUDRAFT_253593 [Daphnia pulex]|uniref:Uncharacterized protein n=1 Tax=Daphnia pulex TaxID=6669 RepID=E9H561_DAPPU|nr:hypothetical protein DAPPUDRAFT_253593 [Daphnia pulex]|eukprot:EFX73134.1 hypothetical protein DAPPUDRAFT_253593 [Daphnia pulex]